VLIAELKEQRRWVVWRLETVNGKLTKVPYQPNGRKAKANDAATWHTHAECAAVASQYSGVGVVLGDGVWGVDIDGCCDAVTGKFTPESREIVIALDSYGEYSPSGTGCHVLGVGTLPGPGLKKPYPGCKAVEVKSEGFYFTFTGRHLSKTPPELMGRQTQVPALYERVSKLSAPRNSLTVTMHRSEEERFAKLMAGDMSDHNDDHSTADFALCVLLAKKHGCNAFKIEAECRESGLYREKWERDDYREGTITRAVKAVAKEAPVIFDDPGEPIEDDGVTEYLVEALPEPMHEGWFRWAKSRSSAALPALGKPRGRCRSWRRFARVEMCSATHPSRVTIGCCCTTVQRRPCSGRSSR
jgi:putative DNA primase/helicase